jgi:membrane protease YdiL (CAAX protease family)
MTSQPSQEPGDGILDALPAEPVLNALPAKSTSEDNSGRVARRGHPILAWLVILGLVGVILWRHAVVSTEQSGAVDSAVALVSTQAEARYLVGAASFNLPGAGKELLYEHAKEKMDRGSYSQRLRFAVLAGELAGPPEALEALEQLEGDRHAGKVTARPVSIEAAKKLKHLYAGYKKEAVKPILPESDQEWLRQRMGWFGDLALAPEGGDEDLRAHVLVAARRTFIGMLVVALMALGALPVGGFLLLLLIFLVCLGRLRGGLVCGSGHGGIYAETFALYMVLYLALGLLARFLGLGGGDSSLALSGLVALLTLVVLGWPVLRGVPWRRVREDVGLTLGERPFVQGLCGPACYLCALPLLVVGLAIVYVLMLLQKRLGGEPTSPSHPIVSAGLSPSVWLWVQVFVVACIIAPLVEEIMFRGILYRHLREATCRWGRWLSIAASVLVSSFVFAVIHPQGWLGVPVLMALAIAFALAREWRQSLLPPMIAHGLNNGVSTLLLLVISQ